MNYLLFNPWINEIIIYKGQKNYEINLKWKENLYFSFTTTLLFFPSKVNNEIIIAFSIFIYIPYTVYFHQWHS